MVILMLQREDALYIYWACVNDYIKPQTYNLRDLMGPFRLQRRRSERIPADLKAEYALLSDKINRDDMREGLILNISRTGALLAVHERLELDSKLMLVFDVNVDGKSISTWLRGRVVREQKLEPARYEYEHSCGIDFEKPFNVLKK